MSTTAVNTMATVINIVATAGEYHRTTHAPDLASRIRKTPEIPMAHPDKPIVNIPAGNVT